MTKNEMRKYVNQYCKILDMQFAVYELYARKHGLTAKELFVLYIIWFEPDGCLQSEITEQLSLTKQTTSAIVKKFLTKDYIFLTESKTDRRNKIIQYTAKGKEYAKQIIQPVADAEIASMSEMSDKDITELVRLTTIYSDYMKEKFEKAY
ncbi:MAG: winged helix DNA-binding protein [Acetobacter sp.]|nr:winged helix DNA-binding protein [Bacteroides sp.]MCM1340987.1 winged helix DNA-binding protein [Acetobacter sp.]MCM1432457.1 winged helix DNA-binding protein [Clostridiales bacterium]